MLGGTSTPSGQRFDRGAIITVLNLVTEYRWMPAHHSWREREGSIYGFKGTVQSSKEQFGTGKRVPASWGMCNMSGCICVCFL